MGETDETRGSRARAEQITKGNGGANSLTLTNSEAERTKDRRQQKIPFAERLTNRFPRPRGGRPRSRHTRRVFFHRLQVKLQTVLLALARLPIGLCHSKAGMDRTS
jgi:hypothetical protein